MKFGRDRYGGYESIANQGRKSSFPIVTLIFDKIVFCFLRLLENIEHATIK